MSTTVRRRLLLAALGVLAAAGLGLLVQRLRQGGVPQAAPVALPLTCRLRGHGWSSPKPGQLPVRHTCRQCESLDLPI